MNQIDLEGRVAIVTGGGQGIGLAIADRLHESGAQVICWDHDEQLIGRSQFDGDVVDITDPDAVAAATSKTIETNGRIDILINSAGITGPNATTWDYALDDWHAVIAVNLTGTFITCREVVPHMRKADYGRIVNIASVAGKDGNPNAPAYSASKAG